MYLWALGGNGLEDSPVSYWMILKKSLGGHLKVKSRHSKDKTGVLNRQSPFEKAKGIGINVVNVTAPSPQPQPCVQHLQMAPQI